jgi:ankyrin repeat protein
MLLATERVFPDPRTENGVTPLHLAAKHGDLPLAKLLVKSGADINAVSNRQFTPLSFAVTGQHLDVVKYLLTLPDIDLNVVNMDHQTPLSIAIVANAYRIVRLLLADSRVNVNDFLGPIYFAAKFLRASMFVDIVSRPDFDWTMRGPHNETLLHLICMDLRFDLFKVVISRPEFRAETDLNAVDEANQTALSRACASCSPRCVRELLALEGIDVNHKDAAGWSALHYACQAGSSDVVIPLLMHPEMDINAVTNGGSRPLHMIVNAGLVDALTAICWRTDLEINSFTQCQKPVTALMICAYNNTPDLMRILLNYPGIDPYIQSPGGRTAHSIAAKRHFKDCAKLTARRDPESRPMPEMKTHRRVTMLPRRSARLVV